MYEFAPPVVSCQIPVPSRMPGKRAGALWPGAARCPAGALPGAQVPRLCGSLLRVAAPPKKTLEAL